MIDYKYLENTTRCECGQGGGVRESSRQLSTSCVSCVARRFRGDESCGGEKHKLAWKGHNTFTMKATRGRQHLSSAERFGRI